MVLHDRFPLIMTYSFVEPYLLNDEIWSCPTEILFLRSMVSYNYIAIDSSIWQAFGSEKLQAINTK